VRTGDGLKVLVIGSGGREHALCWKIKKSRWVNKVFCAPGNAGIANIAECVPIKDSDLDQLMDWVLKNEIDLTVVGPELPLANGIVDRFSERGLKIFGPTSSAARLESSKAFAKEFMQRQNIPTAEARIFTKPSEAKRYIKEIGGRMVVKADGLASGKGVIPSEDEAEALRAVDRMAKGEFGDAGKRIVIEEYLDGEEASMLAFSDGKHVIPLESAQDHKRVNDDDQGPNTGGMGAYSPAPVITKDLQSRIYDEILLPTVRGMAAEGTPYTGILYAGIMVTNRGPKVIEFNCRFGDPETQVILPRMATDIIRPLLGCCEGNLDRVKIRWSRSWAVNVVMASGGYPGHYEKGKVIDGLDAVESDTRYVFHSGTSRDPSGKLLTAGGRVLSVTSMGADLVSAIKGAYDGVRRIKFEGAHFRKDIARKAHYHVEDI
jgi:phosphoribosylamine--glycine ligase